MNSILLNKQNATIYFLFLIIMYISTSCHSSIHITAIDKLRNDSEANSFKNENSNGVLYFQIENFKDLAPAIIAREISDYLKREKIEEQVTARKSEAYCYFYQKKIFKNYKKILGEQESIGDSGSLFDESQNLVALVTYSFYNEKYERNIIIYETDTKKTKILLEQKLDL